VEGGARVFTSFLRARLWDAMFLFYSPSAFGKNGVPVYANTDPHAPDAVAIDGIRLDHDYLHRYLNRATHDRIVAELIRKAGA
jgi:riboflavin biosynthesis pyrimidine reductase